MEEIEKLFSSPLKPGGSLSDTKKGTPRLLLSTLALFVVLTAAYIASIDLRASRGASITGDEPFYLLTTQSLLQDGDLDLTQQYQAHSYRTFFDHPGGLWQQSVRGDNGVLLSPHNPGLSVLLIPGFALGGLLGAQVQLLLLTALTFALTYILISRVTRERVWSWLAAATVGLTASAFVYSTEIYPEMPAGLLLVVSLLLLQQSRVQGAWRGLLLAAVLSGMVWLGVKYVPLAGLLALWGLWRMDSSGRATLLSGGVISALMFIWFHLATFGALTPYSVGVVYAGDASLAVLEQHFSVSDRVYRLVGLFVDQRFGLGRWAPVLLLAVPALLLAWKQSYLSRLALALILTQLFIATFLAVTMMGWWFPGRTMITVLPLLALPLTLLLVRLPRWGRAVTGLLAIYSLAITAALAYSGHTGEITIAVDPFDMPASLFQIATPLFPDYRLWNAETWLLTVLWSASAVAAFAFPFGLPHRLGHTLESYTRLLRTKRREALSV